MQKILWFLTFVIGSFLSCRAETVPFPIWPDGIPNALRANGISESISFWNGDKSWPLVSSVTNPTLEVFSPATGKRNGTAVLIFPGGGYTALNIEKEGRALARWLSERGVTAFVVKYRLPNPRIMSDRSIGPLQDAQAALRLVRRRADDWQIKRDRIGVAGFSAGGHLAATLCTLYSEKTYDDRDGMSARPDFAILVYPLISMRPEFTGNGLRHDLLGEHPSKELIEKFSPELHVSSETPPTFLVHAKDDQAVPFKQSVLYADALKAHGVPAELHLYAKGNHGFGLGATPGWPSEWPEELARWMKACGFL